MGDTSSAAIAASTHRFAPEGWVAWSVVVLGVLTACVSLWAMVESIMTTHSAATQFWTVVGSALQQVCIQIILIKTVF